MHYTTRTTNFNTSNYTPKIIEEIWERRYGGQKKAQNSRKKAKEKRAAKRALHNHIVSSFLSQHSSTS
jgi:hypothetical protein